MKTKWKLTFALALVANWLTGGVTSAQTQHNNGLGQTFTDMAPLGVPGNAATYTLALAQAAANAWPGSGTVNSAQCGGAVATAPKMVMKQSPTQCAVWAYTRNLAGYVHLNTANNTCYCPSTSDAVWK